MWRRRADGRGGYQGYQEGYRVVLSCDWLAQPRVPGYHPNITKDIFLEKSVRGAALRKTPLFTSKNNAYWVLVKSAGTPVPRYPVESESVVGADFRFWMGYHLLRKVLVPLKTFKFQKRASLENLKAKE